VVDFPSRCSLSAGRVVSLLCGVSPVPLLRRNRALPLQSTSNSFVLKKQSLLKEPKKETILPSIEDRIALNHIYIT
jgi:hypothetical protein